MAHCSGHSPLKVATTNAQSREASTGHAIKPVCGRRKIDDVARPSTSALASKPIRTDSRCTASAPARSSADRLRQAVLAFVEQAFPFFTGCEATTRAAGSSGRVFDRAPFSEAASRIRRHACRAAEPFRDRPNAVLRRATRRTGDRQLTGDAGCRLSCQCKTRSPINERVASSRKVSP